MWTGLRLFSSLAAVSFVGGSRFVVEAAAATSSSPGVITIYSKMGCRHCEAAKRLLQQKDWKYREIDIGLHPEMIPQFQKLTGKSSVPQIFFNSRLIGGNDALQLLEQQGALNGLLDDLRAAGPLSPDNDPWVDCLSSFSDGERKTASPPLPLSAQWASHSQAWNLVCAMRDSSSSLTISRQRGHAKVFSGRDAVDWLVKERELSRNDAQAAMEDLLKGGFLHACVDDKSDSNQHGIFTDDAATVYRFQADASSSHLNGSIRRVENPKLQPVLLSQQLFSHINCLFERHRTLDDGKYVSLVAVRADPEFVAFESGCAALTSVNLELLTVPERTAFLLNVYNTLTLHGHVVRGPPRSFFARLFFFKQVSYQIGAHVYSLDDIEHGLLRCNRKSPAAFFPQFGKSDPRLAYTVGENEFDGRIHTALNCGAKSCPMIRIYSAEHLEAELQLAAAGFLDSSSVDVKKKQVTLSLIFKWYQTDFGSEQDLLAWIYRHGSSSLQSSLQPLLMEDKGNGKGKVSPSKIKILWEVYDWDTAGKMI